MWVSGYTLYGVLSSIRLLLLDPNPDSPANSISAKMFHDNFDEYKKDREEKMKERMNNFRDNRGDRMGGGRRSQ